MIRYGMLKKELVKIQNEKNIKYKSKYDFHVSKKMYKKLIINRVAVASILTSTTLFMFLSENNGTAFHMYLIIGLLLLIDGAICVECYWRYNKFYPKLHFQYDEGRIEYCDGRKKYQFKSKELVDVDIETYPRTNKWRLKFKLESTEKYIYMDLVLFSDKKIIFGLLNQGVDKRYR